MTTKQYFANKIDRSQELSFLNPSLAWSEASTLSDFHYPWTPRTPPKTTFKALHCSSYLYFQFLAIDPELNALVDNNDQMEVTESDRVEIFFRSDASMTPYYCLEMDFLGRRLENSAVFHRQMDFDWSWPEGLTSQARETPEGYEVIGRISKSSLETLNLLQNNQIELGLFRGEYKQSPEKGQTTVKWISWVDPGTPQPDFHVPSAFGTLFLV